MKLKLFVQFSTTIATALAVVVPAYAATGLTYHGRIIKPNGSPLEAASVTFHIQIRSPNTDNCLIYDEQQTLNMGSSAGVFVLTIGEGTRVAAAADGGYSISRLFANRGTLTGLTCDFGNSYSPGAADGRKLQVQFNDGSGWQALPAQNINYVPLAIESVQVGGYGKDQLLRVADGTTATEFTNANWTELWALITGTSSVYSKADGSNFSPTASVNFNGQIATNLAAPVGNTDATTKQYVDARVGGKTADVTGVSNLAGNGRVLVWNQALNMWETGVPNDSTKLPLAGGTMSGAINMGAFSLTNVGHVVVADQGTMYLGKFDATQESALIATPLNTTTDRGRTWFNVTTGKMRYWDGTAAHDVATKAYVDSAVNGAGDLKSNGSVAMTADWDVDGIGAGTRRFTGFASPTVADGVATKGYSDSNLLGNVLATPVGQAGQSIRWNAGNTAWEYFTPQAALGYTPVNKAGDTMSGLLVLSADPSAALGAATKQYVDSSVSTASGNFVRKDGTIAMTANWDLNGATAGGTILLTGVGTPTVADGVATKGYVDTRFITKTLPAAPALAQNGQSIRWNNTGNVWEYYTAGNGNGDALKADPLSQFAATTSAQLAGVLSDETGSGLAVFGTSPTLTTPTIVTNATVPMIIGGTATTSTLTYKTTTAAGAAGADHIFQVGNNGATEAMRILNNGNVGIGTTAPDGRLAVVGESNLTSGYGYGVNSWFTANPASASTADFANYLGVGSSGASNVAKLTGAYSEAWHDSTGTVSTAVGLYALLTKNSTGPITNAYGVKVNMSNASATGSITNAYGVFVGNMTRTGAITTSYGLYVADSTASNYFAGSVGIGTTTPTAALHLKAGTAAANTAPLKLTSGVNLTTPEAGAIEFDGTNLFYTDSGAVRRTLASAGGTSTFTNVSSISGPGAISISAGGTNQNVSLAASGTGVVTTASPLTVTNATASTSPSTGALQVSGGAGIAGALNVGGAITSSAAITTQSSTAATSLANQSSPSIFLTANYWDGLASQLDKWSITNIMGTGANPSSTITFDHPSGTTGAKQYAFMNGNVGVGTINPSRRLHLYGGSGTPGFTFDGLAIQNTPYNNLLSIDGVGDDHYVRAYGDDGTTEVANMRMHGYSNGTKAASISFSTKTGAGALTERMVIGEDGNVGIGTTNLGAKLSIATGAAATEGLNITAFTGQTAAIARFYRADTNSSHVFGPEGSLYMGDAAPLTNVNIATGPSTSDTARLRVKQNVTGGANIHLGGSAVQGGNPASPNIYFGDGDRALSAIRGTALTGVNWTDAAGELSFLTTPDVSTTALTERMRIAKNGNVGIGTTTPTAALHLKAGTAAANTAPLKLTSGVNLTTPEAGAIEFDGTNLFYTDSGAVRRTLASASGTSTFTNVSSISGPGAISISAGGTNQNLSLAASGTGVVTTASPLTVTNATASTSPTTGALQVSGGAGISGALNVGGAIASNSSITTQSATAATSLANQSSPSIFLTANYWDGLASQVDKWSMTNIMGAGANPTSTLTFDHPSGTTGAKQYAFMNGNVGIGTTNPNSKLEVNGSITNAYTTSAGSVQDNNGFINLSVVNIRDSAGGATNPVTHIRAYSGDEMGSPTQTMFSARHGSFYAGQNNINYDSRVRFHSRGSYHYRAYSESENKDTFWIKATGGVTTNNTADMYVSGDVGIGTTNPTATLHLKAGTAAANTAPLKFTAGLVQTTPEDGAMEYSGTALSFAIGTTRYNIPLNATAGSFENVTNISNAAGSITMTPAVSSSVIINQTTASTSPSTGALVVNGGVGVAGRVNVAGTTGDPATTGTAQNGSLRLGNSNHVLDFGATAAAPWGSWIQSVDRTNLAVNYNLLLNPNGGNVGVGTFAPTGKVHINDPTPSSVPILKISSPGLPLGEAAPFYGLHLNTQAQNNATSSYGGYFNMISTGQTSHGIYAQTSTGSTQGFGVYGKATHVDVNGPGIAYGVYGQAAAAGVGVAGSTYAGYFDNTSAIGAKSVGLYTNTVAGATDAASLIAAVGGVEKFRVHSNGNIGIGTNNPLAKLDVDGGTGKGRVQADVSGTSPNLILTGDATGGYYPQIDFRPLGSSTLGGRITSYSSTGGIIAIGRGGPVEARSDAPGNLVFSVRGAAAQTEDFFQIRTSGANVGDIMSVKSSGNVGIGTTTPAGRLHTEDTILNQVSCPAGYTMADYDADTVADDCRAIGLVALANSNVGIGLSNPTYQLQLSTDSAAKPGTSTWTIASDMRLKNIRAPFTRGLSALEGIETVYFNYKADNPLGLTSDKEYVGIRAQDVEKSVPEAVRKDKDGYLHVTNDAIIWTMFNAIKELYHKWNNDSGELHRKNSDLSSRVDQLVEQNKMLIERLEKLENSQRHYRNPASQK